MRRPEKRPESDGFSLLEMVIVIGLIAFLFAVALDKLLPVRVDAERAAMENVVGVLRSTVGMKFAQMVVAGRKNATAGMAGSNPMELLAERPGNYVGSFPDPDPSAIRPGSWYFDERSRALVYKVWNDQYFEGGLTAPARARFVVRPVYAQGGNPVIEGLGLDAVEPYRWTN